jgi:hypothetical protein
MLRFPLASLIALALPFAPAQAQAQQAAPTEPFTLDRLADPAITKAIKQGEIEVASTGEIIVQGTTEKEIRNFVWRSITPMSRSCRTAMRCTRTVAVRSAPVCLSFDNISNELEGQLRQRIAENLSAIGTELAQPGCQVNAAVTFPRDANAFMRWLNSNKRQIFGAMYEPERRRHALQRRLAYNWHYVPEKAAMRDYQRAGGQLTDSWVLQQILLNALGSTVIPLSRQLGTDTISHSFTVIEASAIDGVSPTQLADYITMHALVMFEPGVREEIPAGSILRLFADKGANPEAAEEMSAVDRVVLSTIYRRGRNFFDAGLIRAEVARTAMQGEP